MKTSYQPFSLPASRVPTESGQIWRDCPCLHRMVYTAVTGQEGQDRVQLAWHCDKGLLPDSTTGFPLGGCPEGSEVIPDHLTLLWKYKLNSVPGMRFLFSLRKSGFPALGDGKRE